MIIVWNMWKNIVHMMKIPIINFYLIVFVILIKILYTWNKSSKIMHKEKSRVFGKTYLEGLSQMPYQANFHPQSKNVLQNCFHLREKYFTRMKCNLWTSLQWCCKYPHRPQNQFHKWRNGKKRDPLVEYCLIPLRTIQLEKGIRQWKW